MFKSSFSRGREHLARLTKASKFHSDARNVSNKQVIYGIIGLNVGVFGAWTLADINPYLKKIMNNNFLLSYNGFWHNGRVHTLITAVFSHKSLIHLAENMFTLYFFGSSAIAVLGARQFLGLYFGGGIFSSLCAVTWPDLVPSFWPARWKSSRYASALGASGAGGCLSIKTTCTKTLAFTKIKLSVCALLFVSVCSGHVEHPVQPLQPHHGHPRAVCPLRRDIHRKRSARLV